MRYFKLIIVLLILCIKSYSQKLDDFPTIPIQSKFTLKLIPNNFGGFNYNLLEIESIDSDLNLGEANTLLSNNLPKDEVQGVFGIGDFGNTKSTLLIIKTGNDNFLDYELFIDIKNNGKYKQTSTTPIYNFPSLEVWQNQIYSIKIKNIKKSDQVIFGTNTKLDTICTGKYDLIEGNRIFENQIDFILNLVSKEEKRNSEIERIKKFEDSIQSSISSSWGWGDKLLIRVEGRYMDGYIDSGKVKQPLVYEFTECPNLKRYIGYYFTKSKKDVKMVVQAWKLRRVNGWYSRDYESVAADFREKYNFVKNTLSSRMPIDKSDHPNHESALYSIDWFKKDNTTAKLAFYIDESDKSYNLNLYIFKND